MNMLKKFPWENHPDLTKKRLLIIARVLRNVRNETIDETRKPKEVPWATGCMVYERSKVQLEKLCIEHDWFNIFDPTTHTFQIGIVPIKFYRGEPDSPSIRTLAINHDELKQLSIAFPEEKDNKEVLWRFAVDTDTNGKTLSVHFAALSLSGNPLCVWSPKSKELRNVEPSSFPQEESVILDKPIIGPKTNDKSGEEISIPKIETG